MWPFSTMPKFSLPALAGTLYLGERLSSIQLMVEVVIICMLAVQLAPMFTRKTAEAV